MKGWLIFASLLLLFFGGWIWWQNRRTTLRTVALVHGDTLIDLAEPGLLIADGEDIVYYDWKGRRQARYHVIALDSVRDQPGTGWDRGGMKWIREWPAADASGYHEYSRPLRTLDYAGKLARFSPRGTYVGIIAYHTQQLDVSVWHGQALCWRTSYAISPDSPVTGAVPVDLLVSEQGHVLLYTPGRQPIPMVELSKGTMRTTHVQSAYAELVHEYIRAIAPHPVHWKHGFNIRNGLLAQSADGRFLFVDQEYKLKFDRYLLPLAQYSGRTHLTVQEYPGKKRGERWGMTKQFDDRWLIAVPFTGKRDFKFDGGVWHTPYFAPDGRHLVIRNWYGELFGICAF
ncbi:MAG: hypothetical protein ACYC6A_16135 [Armatimonadota bacterium]